MADNRYGGDGRREGWRGREGSIFSDDDDRWSRGSGRWSRDQDRERGARGGDDRGFFERAGDEVRSWFGDDDAEQRRESDVTRDEGRGSAGGDQGYRPQGARGGSYRSNYGSASYGAESGGSYGRGQSGSSRDREQGGQYGGQADYRGREADFRRDPADLGGGGRSQWDDNYRRWRDQQIAQFDREYDDYCRERQQQFDQDFDGWRSSRLTQGGMSDQSGGASGQFGGSSSGQTGQQSGGGTSGQSDDTSRIQGKAGATSGSAGAETAATTTTAGGTGSAMESSTGSSGGGRGGRSRA